MLVAGVHSKTDCSGGIEIAQHHAVGAVGHNTEQFSGFAENEVAARWIKFSEQAPQDTAVQFHVIRSG